MLKNNLKKSFLFHLKFKQIASLTVNNSAAENAFWGDDRIEMQRIVVTTYVGEGFYILQQCIWTSNEAKITWSDCWLKINMKWKAE